MTIWEKTKGIAIWTGSNTFLWATALAGVLLKMGWAFHLFAFATWILTLGHMIAFIIVHHESSHSDNLSETTIAILRRSRPIPASLDVSLDIVLIGILVAFGHWFYGILLLIHTLLYQGIYEDIEKIKLQFRNPNGSVV